MQSRTIGKMLLASIIVALCSFAFNCCGSHKTVADTQFPFVTIWAWDAPNDLRFLTSSKESIALYAGTIFIGEDTAYFKPNSKLFKFSGTTHVFPVFRIESRGKAKDANGDAQIAKIVQIVAAYLADHEQMGTPTVQIDFDATESERNFYRTFLKQLRLTLGPQTRISVTALASWCLGDRWLSHQDVDEAVVMLFSMGESESEILKHAARDELFAGKDIPMAIGMSANEGRTDAILLKYKDLFRGRHLYFFNSLPWTEKSLRQTENNLCIVNQK